MAEYSDKKIIVRSWDPKTLETLTLNRVVEMLLKLNDSKINAQFPWLSNNFNPFLCIPQKILEHIIYKLADKLYASNKIIQKEILKILICKHLKCLDFSNRYIKGRDLLDVLTLIQSTKSKPRYLGVSTCNLLVEDNPWIKVADAVIFLKQLLINMPTLTHLNVNGICDDSLLQVVALGCPNLIILEADSEAVTSEGLKSLCMSTRNAADDQKRCQNLEKIILDPFRDDDSLLEGIKALLLSLPNLHFLECSQKTLSKAVEKLHDDSHESIKFQLKEFHYDGSFNNLHLPSAIAMRCPVLTTLRICNVSNGELLRFEYISNLKDIWISSYDDFLNFENGIAPFLQKMGTHLEVLSLCDFDDVDFNVIDICCPNLIKLKCFSIGALRGKISMIPVFRNIQDLYLNSFISIGMQPIHCIRLLSKCYYLKHLKFSCCEDLRWCHLKEVLLRNPLINLTEIDISCDSFSLKGTATNLMSLIRPIILNH